LESGPSALAYPIAHFELNSLRAQDIHNYFWDGVTMAYRISKEECMVYLDSVFFLVDQTHNFFHLYSVLQHHPRSIFIIVSVTDFLLIEFSLENNLAWQI
jgi:hypothetical protein